MIHLQLEPYCAHCMIFEAVMDRPEPKWIKDENGKMVKRYFRNSKHSDVIWVKCKYAPACKEIYSKLKETDQCTTENSPS